MFIVILTMFALADYVITIYYVINMVTKPAVKTTEIPKVVSVGVGQQTVNNAVAGHVVNDKELIESIEEQNSRIALLSVNVNEILSNIDSIIESADSRRGVLQG